MHPDFSTKHTARVKPLQCIAVVYQKRTFSAFGFRFWLPNLKAEYGHLQKQITRQIILDQKLYLQNPMRIQRKKLPYGIFLHKSNKEKK